MLKMPIIYNFDISYNVSQLAGLPVRERFNQANPLLTELLS